MANVVAITKIQDGPRNAIFHLYLESDGSGELTDEVLIDPTVDFDPALPGKPIMIIEKLWYNLVGFSAALKFDYLVEGTPVWVVSEDGDADFSPMGGLKDRSGEIDGTGKLLLSTVGFATAGEHGTIILQIKKAYPE